MTDRYGEIFGAYRTRYGQKEINTGEPLGTVHGDRICTPESLSTICDAALERYDAMLEGRKTDRPNLPRITLASGSLLLMPGDFNSRYRHGIDPDVLITEPRTSFTFRAFSSKPQLVAARTKD